MVILDDLPPQIQSVLWAPKRRDYNELVIKEADEILSQLTDEESTKDRVAILDNLCDDNDFNFKQWFDKVIPIIEISKSDNRGLEEAIKNKVKESIVAATISQWLKIRLESDRISWDLVDRILSQTTASSGIAWNLERSIDGELRHQMINFLRACPTTLSYWLPSYYFDKEDGERIASTASSEWHYACNNGRMKVPDSFFPIHYSSIPILSLLLKWDELSYYDLIERLPLPGIIEILIETSIRETSDAYSLLKTIPSYSSGSRVHPALPITVYSMIKRVTEIRSELQSAKRAAHNSAQENDANEAIAQFEEWRDSWILRVLNAIEKRDDTSRILPELLADYLADLIWFDSRDRYDKDCIEDRKSIVFHIADSMESIPNPLREPSDSGDIDGRFASWLMRTWKTYTSLNLEYLDDSHADRLWNELAYLIPDIPTGILRGAYTPRPLSNWSNGLMASVLRDTKNTVESWKKLWIECGPMRTGLNTNDEDLFCKVKINSIVLIIGLLSFYGEFQTNEQTMNRELEDYWSLLNKEAISFLNSTPFPIIVGADFGVINCAFVATKLPDGDRRIREIQDSVNQFDKLASSVEDIRANLLAK